MALKFTRLTRPNIRVLKPGEAITEHGITAEHEASGDIRYSVNIMVDGQRVHRVVGRESDGTTRTQAEEFITQTRADAKAQRLNLPKGRSVPLTVAKAAKLYLKAMKDTGGKNLKSKREHIRLHITPYLGVMQLDKVSDFTLRKFHKHMLETGKAEAMANRVASTWNHMAKWLTTAGGDETRPQHRLYDKQIPMMKKAKEQNRRTFIFSDEDERRLIEAAGRDPNEHVWLFCQMGFGTSMRHSEIRSSRYDNFDPEARRLRIKVKGGKWRDQPMPQWLVDILVEQRQMAGDPNGWIFPSKTSRAGYTDSLKGPFKRCAIAAGLDPSRAVPHAMRHTAITRYSAVCNGDVALIKQFSGHESLEMILRYSHPSRARVDEALARVPTGNVVTIRKGDARV